MHEANRNYDSYSFSVEAISVYLSVPAPGKSLYQGLEKKLSKKQGNNLYIKVFLDKRNYLKYKMRI